MGYLKQRFLEGISRDEIIPPLKVVKETRVTLQKYERGKQKKLTDEEEKQLDEMINCQIEDAKIKRSEKMEGGAGILG
jgi:hypothetical protein